MALSKYPSKIHLPDNNSKHETVLDFLVEKFPAIAAEIWQKRLADGKVHWLDGSIINTQTAYQPHQCVCYYREVEQEPVIPFTEQVLFQNENILVAYKPHFLPVTPGGMYVQECLQNRLRQKTGIETLQALHRLDRETAGLVLFSVNPENRHLYHDLFANRKITKTYQAVAKVDIDEKLLNKNWEVKNRLIKSEPRFLMQIVQGQMNAHSMIQCIQQKHDKALFELQPITGKTHQLRLHMQSIGFPILHDKFYPELQAKTEDDFSKPLQLLARQLSFIDPVSQQLMSFSTEQSLQL